MILKGSKRGESMQMARHLLNAEQNERVEVFEQALEAIEKKLNMENQPRVLVFHEKEGRRHAHAVYSRINSETMTTIDLPYFKNKLMDVSKALYLEHG